MSLLDALLLDLITGAVIAITAQQKQDVLDHIGCAPFRPTQSRKLAEWFLNSSQYVGLPHPSIPGQVLTTATQITNLDYHVLKHTQSGEWPKGTTAGEYLSDVRAAAKAAKALHVGIADGANRAGTCPDVQSLKLPLRVTRQANHLLLTLYDPGGGWLVSGYLLPRTKVAGSIKQRWSNYRCL